MNLWPVEHFFPQFGVPYSIQVPQIEEKMFNWSEVHLYRSISYKIHILVMYPFFKN